MQFRGSKKVTVFPGWDERVVAPDECEEFMARTGRRPSWRPEVETLGETFSFAPGQALHIPFIAGHHVQNGPDDVSISMSIIFNTRQTVALSKALMFNHQIRKLGYKPEAVGRSPWRDQSKALLFRGASWVRRNLRRSAA